MKTEKINVQKICLIAFAICINFVGGQIALFLASVTLRLLFFFSLCGYTFSICCKLTSDIISTPF